jgi:hypothetical protein
VPVARRRFFRNVEMKCAEMTACADIGSKRARTEHFTPVTNGGYYVPLGDSIDMRFAAYLVSDVWCGSVWS